MVLQAERAQNDEDACTYTIFDARAMYEIAVGRTPRRRDDILNSIFRGVFFEPFPSHPLSLLGE